MAMVINSNIMSLNAQRNLMGSQGDLNTAMERLSSGLRINSAADDAAGLAISSRFDSQVRGLNQAIRNANDGISLINTAEGALQEGTNILQRMRELAIQSANGIYSDENRASLNAEVEQLKAELTRIAETTSFNGLKILDGTLGDIDLQVGASAFENITLNVGSGYTAEALGAADGGVSSGSFTLAEVASVGQSGSSGTLEALGTNDLEINGISIPAATGSFDTVSTSDNTASALAVATAINSVSDETGVVAEANNIVNLGTLSVQSKFDFGTITVATAAADLGDGDLVINGTSIRTDNVASLNTIGTTSLDAAGGAADTVAAINYYTSSTGVSAAVGAGNTVILTSLDGGDITLDSDGGASANFTFSNNLVANGTNFPEVSLDVTGTTLVGTDLVINGQQITGEIESAADLADTISNTVEGVSASVNSAGELILTAEDGRNIQIYTDGDMPAATATAGSVSLVAIDVTAESDNTFSGQVTLRSNEAIEIGGNDPSALGFTAGATEASTTSALQETAGSAPTMSLNVTNNDSMNDGNTSTSFTLNGQTITFNAVDGGTASADEDSTATNLRDAINASTELTGVSASIDPLDSSQVVLVGGVGGRIDLTTDVSGAAAATNVDIDVTAIDGVTSLVDAGGNDYTDIFEASAENADGTYSAVGTSTAATFDDMVNGDLTINGYTVDFTNAASLLSTDNERSTVDPTASAQFTALAINNTEGLSDQLVATAYTEMNLGEVQAGAADDQFTLIVNGLVVDIDNPIVDDDANGNIAGTLNGAFAEAASLYDADPVANAAYADAAGLLASVNDAGELVITANDGRNITVSVGGTANGDSLLSGFDVTAAGSVTAKGTISLEANDGFTVGEIGGDRRTLAGIESAGGSVADINISTQRGANEAIDVIDRAIDEINSARGDLGAASNRLDFTINNLSNVVENAAAARSRIQDADFAAESAALSRAQVLQQAGTAMLAQANAQPQQVLSLLQ